MASISNQRDPDVLIGGRYRLLRRLGTGGMGTVWAGRDEVLLRDVAVKELTLPQGLSADQQEAFRTRSMREARAAARIGTDAAITVHDVVQQDGRPWIVMELLDPRTLSDRLREQGPLPAQEVAQIGLRLLDALTAAHKAGVLHRDVKPGNVLFDAAGRAVLTDFGIASLEGDSSTTVTGTVLGSPGYIAPERARGKPPSQASDLWSLGVTLYAGVMGHSPFERAEGPLATLAAVLEDVPAIPAHAGALAPVLEGLLRRDPGERLTTAQTRSLLSAAAAQPSPSPAPPSPEDSATERIQPLPMLPQPTMDLPTQEESTTVTNAVVPPAPVTVEPVLPPDSEAPADAYVALSAPQPSRRRRTGVLLAVVPVVVLAGVAGAFALSGNDPEAPAASPAPATSSAAIATPTTGTSATTPARPSTSATATPTSSAPAADEDDNDDADAPAGFDSYESEDYAVAIPADWEADTSNDIRTYFRDPDSGSYLLVEEGGTPNGDPVADWRRQESSVSSRLNGYSRIRIDRAQLPGFDDAADWEFTWQSRNGQLHVLNRAVIVDGKAYGLYWSVPEERWAASREDFEAITRSFRPDP